LVGAEGTIQSLVKRHFIPLLLAAFPALALAGEFTGVENLAARRVPWLAGHVRFEKLAEASGDAFELQTMAGKLVVRASNSNSAAAGLGWYLKYSCHRSMSHMGDNLSPVGTLPSLATPIRIESWARQRYALNYCTFNYTMSFYSWEEWEHELDWMALSGVNLMLVANGEEAVWRNTLQRLEYSEDEISRFIPGPGYTAWWLMGNLEGAGGPMTTGMIRSRSEIQERMIIRMRSLGIEPVLPGFYGMVPSSLGQKLKAHIVDQGKWSGFHRPGILDPTDPEFSRVAGIYYEELKKLYGPDIHYFSGDPFHEGGVMAGVDLGRAGVGIQSAMQAHFPGSTWVLQGWIENPRKELIAATDRTHVLVQELFGEQTRNWETRRGYEGTPFVWCCIDNFGERPGLFGRLQHYSDETFRARTGEFGRYLQGTGIMPEGIANNPVAYDLVLELAWHRDHVDAGRWLAGYVEYRYGRSDADIADAWALLLKTAYGDAGTGIPENVLCARPTMPATSASHWGSLDLPYDPAVFAAAVELFARAEGRFKDSETYRLDLVSLRLQALSNDALGISHQVQHALAQKDRAAFEEASARFMGLGGSIDKLLQAEPFYRLATYRDQALRYGNTDAERRNSLRNAMMLVTYWAGDDRRSDELHDYAFKAWSGMMATYSMRRWEMFFDNVRQSWDGKAAAAPDYFAWERQWVAENSAPQPGRIP
jgi:alpha-N-acetylglucosaminidase